jgi:eukaryotic-like serine/threonine-protein kinase
VKIISVHNNLNGPVSSGPTASTLPPATPLVGRLLGIWRLGELLYSGSNSQLWSAQPADSSGSPRWDYVLRTIPRQGLQPVDREEAIGQMRRFTEATSSARHPHLVAVLDASMEGTDPFIVMPRLLGQSLAQVLARAVPQPLPVVLWFVRQTAQAASALHEAGWIHGDIKPENVLVSPQGHATLLDLGFARRIGQPADGRFRGSVAYAAPECLQTEPLPAAAASDVFSLGRLLWQLLSLTDKDQMLGTNIDPVAGLVAELVQDDPAARPTANNVAEQLIRLEIETLGQHIRPRHQTADRKAA